MKFNKIRLYEEKATGEFDRLANAKKDLVPIGETVGFASNWNTKDYILYQSQIQQGLRKFLCMMPRAQCEAAAAFKIFSNEFDPESPEFEASGELYRITEVHDVVKWRVLFGEKFR